MKHISILFVCHGNICRSPMAEFILKYMVAEKGLEQFFLINSAATSTEEIGNDIYPPAQRCLRAHGINDAVHHARQITGSDYAQYDLIIGMDTYNIANLKRFFNQDPDGKIMMLNSSPISDPWYTGDFETCYAEIKKGCETLLAGLVPTRK